MANDKLRCPDCKSAKVAVTAETMYMVNTGDHYCHSVKTHDPDAKACCLKCDWGGFSSGLVTIRKGE